MSQPAALYNGLVYHARHTPFFHAFRYPVFTAVFDIDALDSIAKTCRLFSHNRFNLFSLYDRDHGPRTGAPLRPWIEGIAAENGLNIAGGRITMLGFPRMLGYVFNPITLFFLYDAKGVLRAILHQVKNTFSEQHCYFIPVIQGASPTIAQHCQKIFHVSPFIAMDCTYAFKINPPANDADGFDVIINQTYAGGRMLTATWSGKDKRTMTDRALLGTFLRFPFLTLRIMWAIHWQAFHLWRKGATFYKKPTPPVDDVTYPHP